MEAYRRRSGTFTGTRKTAVYHERGDRAVGGVVFLMREMETVGDVHLGGYGGRATA